MQIHVVANSQVLAALKEDGSVVSWGRSIAGGDSSTAVPRLSSGVAHIC